MRQHRLSLVIVCGLVLLAFAVRATSLEAQSLWRDEVDALRFATAPWAELLHTFRQPGWNGPLYFAWLRGWVALAGQTPFSLRYFSLLPGVLLTPLIYALGRRLLKENGCLAGGLAAACVSLSPYFIWFSQETKMYALVSALVVLAIYALHRALDGRAGWWAVMVIATSLSFYLHILAALLIPLEFGLLLIWRPGARRRWVEALASLACLTVPYLPLLYWQLPLAVTPAQTGYPAYSLLEMVYVLIYRFSAGVAGNNLGVLLALPLAALAVTGALLGAMGLRHRLALATWIALPVLALYIVSLWRPIFTERFLIWIGPALYLLAALGVLVVWRQSRLLAIVSLLLVAAPFGWGMHVQATQPLKSDWRAATQFVEPRAGPGDLLIFQIPHVRYTFDYYYRPPFEWVDGLYTNYGLSDAEVDAHMRASIGAHRVVWLVASEMELWDQQQQVFGWLETHAHRTEAANFTLVNVYRYELP